MDDWERGAQQTAITTYFARCSILPAPVSSSWSIRQILSRLTYWGKFGERNDHLNGVPYTDTWWWDEEKASGGEEGIANLDE